MQRNGIFSGPPQMVVMESERQYVASRISASPATAVDGDLDEVVARFVELCAPECGWQAEILWEEAVADEPHEVNVGSFGAGPGRRVMRYTIHVPVRGDVELLTYARPAGGPTHYPAVDVVPAHGETPAELIFTLMDDGSGAEGVKKKLASAKETIENGFANLKGSFVQHREIMKQRARDAVVKRRGELERQKADLENLGIPIRKRPSGS